MKKIKPTIITLLAVAGQITSHATVLLEDSFDSYATGLVATSPIANKDWSSPIPSTSLTWHTAHSATGPQTIVDAVSLGRSGKVFSYQETVDASNTQSTTFSYVTLSTAYSGEDDWMLSIDFRIDLLERTNGTFSLVDIFDGAVDTTANRNANRLTFVGLQLIGGNYIAIAGSNTSDSGSGIAQFAGSLLEDRWYTLTITGNNVTKSLSYNIIDSFSYNSSIIGKNYKGTHSQFNVISIGDTLAEGGTTGQINHVYLDNLKLTAVPEANSLALILMGMLIVSGIYRRSYRS